MQLIARFLTLPVLLASSLALADPAPPASSPGVSPDVPAAQAWLDSVKRADPDADAKALSDMSRVGQEAYIARHAPREAPQ